jgi:hypothetical protein
VHVIEKTTSIKPFDLHNEKVFSRIREKLLNTDFVSVENDLHAIKRLPLFLNLGYHSKEYLFCCRVISLQDGYIRIQGMNMDDVPYSPYETYLSNITKNVIAIIRNKHFMNSSITGKIKLCIRDFLGLNDHLRDILPVRASIIQELDMERVLLCFKQEMQYDIEAHFLFFLNAFLLARMFYGKSLDPLLKKMAFVYFSGGIVVDIEVDKSGRDTLIIC